VTALEILGEFQTLDEFKTWWTGVQMNTITKSDDAGKPFRKKFRRNATKLFLPPTFPDTRVDIAYLNPDVDSDPESFQWGVPDLNALRSFLMATIGWSQERTDDVLVPVIKDMNRRADEGTQSNITAFFDGGVGIGTAGTSTNGNRREAFAPRKRIAESSKRMGSALSRMADKAKNRDDDVTDQDTNGKVVDDAEQSGSAQDYGAPRSNDTRRTKKKPKRASPIDSVESVEEDESDVVEPKRTNKRRPKHRK
jgi:DNA excision repair protein ERCC-5